MERLMNFCIWRNCKYAECVYQRPQIAQKSRKPSQSLQKDVRLWMVERGQEVHNYNCEGEVQEGEDQEDRQVQSWLHSKSQKQDDRAGDWKIVYAGTLEAETSRTSQGIAYLHSLG